MTMGKRIWVGLVILGLAVSSWTMNVHRIEQAKNNGVLAVLDFQSVMLWAEQLDMSPTELLQEALRHEIYGVAIHETELFVNAEGKLRGFFEHDALVQAYPGFDVFTLHHSAPTISMWGEAIEQGLILENHIYILSYDEGYGRQLAAQAVLKYGKNRVYEVPLPQEEEDTLIDDEEVSVEQPYVFGLRHSASQPINGLGFSISDIEYLKGIGMQVVPRFVNASYDEGEQVAAYLDAILTKTEPPAVIFAGKQGVLGFPYGSLGSSYLHIVASRLKSDDRPQGPLYGYVEMATIPGDRNLARHLGHHLARVHSISNDEWKERFDLPRANKTGDINQVVGRYLLSTQDRSVNILYLRPFTSSVQINGQYFAALQQAFTEAGYQFSETVSAMPGNNAVPLNTLLVLIVGFSSLMVLFFAFFIPLSQWLGWVILGAGVTTLGGLAIISPELHGAIQKFIALGSAVFFPVVGVFSALSLPRLPLTKGFPRWMKSVLGVLQVLFVSTAISLAGATYIHTSLAIRPYLTAVQVFPLVKVALFLPPVIAFFGYYWRKDHGVMGIVRAGEQNVKVYHLLILGGLALGAGYMMMRSGNAPIWGVAQFELRWRLWLQQSLGARPRFKEFLIGYPALALLAYKHIQGHRVGQSILMALAVVGQASLVNTFAHLHKPVNTALLTTFNGLWVGILLGVFALGGYEILLRGWAFVKERN